MLDSPDVASLTLARHPFKTLYYFSCSVASGTASAAHFVATHPVTLGIALPVLLLYVAAKGLGLYTDATGTLEVSMVTSRAGKPAHAFLGRAYGSSMQLLRMHARWCQRTG